MLVAGAIFIAIGIVFIVTRKRVDKWNAQEAMKWQRGPNKNEDLGREGSYAPWNLWAGIAFVVVGLVFIALGFVNG